MNHLTPRIFIRLFLLALFFFDLSSLLANSAKLHISYGLTFFYKKQYVKAFEEFKQALDLEPDNPQAHYNIGRVYKLRGQWELSQKHFEIALGLDPSLVVVQRELLELKKGRQQSLQKRLQTTTEFEMDAAISTISAADNFLARGRKAFEKGDYQQAIQLFSQALAKDPANGDLLSTIGFLYWKTGQLAAARDYYQRALDAGAASGQLYFNLGQVQRQLKNYPAAQQFYEKAVELDGLQLGYHLELANLYEDTGQFDRAFNSFNAILKLDPHNNLAKSRVSGLNRRLGDYFLSRGNYFFASSDWGPAVENFDKALQFGNFKEGTQKLLKKNLSIARYWNDKNLAVAQEKVVQKENVDRAYVGTDFSLDDAVQNPKKYLDRFVRWRGWIQAIDTAKKTLTLSEEKRSEEGLGNYFVVRFKGALPLSDRRVQRFAELLVVGRLMRMETVVNPNTNETSQKLQPVVEARELTFTNPEVAGDLLIKFY